LFKNNIFNILLINDIGEFSLENLLSDKRIKTVKISLSRWNAVAFDAKEGSIVVSFKATDHHDYSITN